MHCTTPLVHLRLAAGFMVVMRARPLHIPMVLTMHSASKYADLPPEAYKELKAYSVSSNHFRHA